ncbi:MAG: hypothetical protein R3A78_15915, partial [Polyangiales bacterium]
RIDANVYGMASNEALVLNVTADGVTTQKTLSGVTSLYNVVLADAFAYSVSIAQQPEHGTCYIRQAPADDPATGFTGHDTHKSGPTRHLEIFCSIQSGQVAVSGTGLLPGVTVPFVLDVGGTQTSYNVSQNNSVTLASITGAFTLSFADPGKQTTVSFGEVYTRCQIKSPMSADPHSYSGTVTAGQTFTLSYTCSWVSCPDPIYCPSMGGGGNGCILDSDCANADCECTTNSGQCTGATGKCGAGKKVIGIPTTDGVTASGTWTVPGNCNEVYIQAWGAGGGAGGMQDFILGGNYIPGGSGGYVSGKISTVPGDVFTVWVGQGGNLNGEAPTGGTSSIGSYFGTPANGGAGDGTKINGASGSGGGLTSVQQTGSANRTFVIPAGGGGTEIYEGGNAGDQDSGTEAGHAGADGASGQVCGGGGAGENGGAGGTSYGERGYGGGYGTLPTGLTSQVATDPYGVNANVHDNSSCVGTTNGFVAAGRGADGFGGLEGGDGCVVFRCVGVNGQP